MKLVFRKLDRGCFSCTKERIKTVSLASKVMASGFWNATWILLLDYIEKGKTVKGEYYACLSDKKDLV